VHIVTPNTSVAAAAAIRFMARLLCQCPSRALHSNSPSAVPDQQAL